MYSYITFIGLDWGKAIRDCFIGYFILPCLRLVRGERGKGLAEGELRVN